MLRQFQRWLTKFGRDRSGNVALTFALAALPLVATVGAAVDYTQANKSKAALQGALDSAALMLSRDAATLSSTDLNTKALSYVTALLNQPQAKDITVNASYTTDGGTKVVVNGSASLPTAFMGIIGINNITIAGSSTTAWGTTRLRVALVLDNTGSMADAGKMTALKSATKDLLAQLKSAASVDGDVYVSIIPFAKDVNIGATTYSASYLDWTDWNGANKTCNGWLFGSTCWGTWVAANHNTWNGCITDRGPSNSPGSSTWDQVVTAPDGTANSKWPAEQYDACPAAMMGLTYNWTNLNSLVDQMQPNGATNQPIGLVWGWQSLVGGGPLTAPAKDANYNYSDIIILMSDGLNTQDRWYGNGSATSTAVDGRMYLSSTGAGTCNNIKSAGVTVYTIQVNTSNDPTSTLLQNCAGSKTKMTDPSKFFMVNNASGIGTVFKQIGTGLTQLRVAK